MGISFNTIPGNLRVPFVTAEFDASRASQGPALLAYRGILIGQKTSAGSAPANSLHRVTSVDQVIEKAGRGSMLHRMAIGWFAVNTTTELWIGVLADNGAGVAGTATIVVDDENPSLPNAQEDSTLVLYIGVERVTVAVSAGDTAAEVATAIAAAINTLPDLPFTANAVSETVTLTYRHKGAVSNDYPITHSYRDGEEIPAGLTVAVTPPSNGATNPVLDDLIAAMGDMWFHVWAHPYTDATSLTDLEAELASRFDPLRMIDGVAITSSYGEHSDLTTLGDSRNSQHSTIVAQAGVPMTPSEEYAAETAGLAALYGQADPARPFQTLAMKHALPPREVDRFTIQERNLLLFDGIATTRVGPGEVVQLDRLITTYQESPGGAPDTAYLDLNTPLTLMYLRYSWRVRIVTRYPRHKLANDGVRLAPGQAVITPKIGKAEALAWFREMEGLGLVEGFDQFKRDLICVRNDQDANRLDWLVSPDLINQFIVGATKMQFLV